MDSLGLAQTERFAPFKVVGGQYPDMFVESFAVNGRIVGVEALLKRKTSLFIRRLEESVNGQR